MASVLSRIQIIMEANTARYNNEMRRARENSSTTFSEIGKSASKAALVVGTALAGMGALSIKTAMSFESSMAEIDKTVEFTSSNGLANMRKELQALTTQIPQTFEELAAVTATGGQLGIAEKDLVHFTEVMAKMGVAFDIPAQQAADSMAKIANVFQIPIANIDRLGDAINTLSNNTPATAAQLIDSLQRVGGVAKVFGLSEDATLGLTGALIAMGKPAEVASTAVNSLLTSFSTLDNATKSQLIGFEQLGLNIDDFSKLVATDGKQAIITYLEAINKLEQSKRIGTNALIIGKEFGDDITMLAGSVGVLENNWAMLGETANTTKEYFGSMDIEFKKISATTANKMKLFKSNIDGVVASIGEAFIPALNELLLNMTPMVATIGTWVSANPELIQQITLVGGSLIGTVLGLKLAVDGFTAAKTTVDGLKLAYAALGTTMGLTVLGLGILLATGALVYQNWDEIKRVVSENQPAFIALGVAVSALTVALVAANAPLILLKVQAAAAAVQAGVMTVATASWSVAAGVGAAATWTFNAALAVLTSPILAVVAAIALIATGGYLVVKNWAAISAGLNAEFNKIKSYVLNTVATMQAAWDRGVANTRGAIINIKNTIVTTLKELPGRMLQIGKDIVNGLINGIKQGASGVATAIGSMASSAVAKAKSVLDIRSPSRVMKTVGEQTAQGMADGIKKGKKAVVTEAQKMAADAVKAVQDGVASLKREIALFGNDSPIAALKYDISVGKFGAADTSQLMSLTQTKEQLELTKKLADANNSVQDSIDGLIKQQALFGNNSSLAALMYDIEHTEKYKGINEELLEVLKEQTRAYEQLGMTAKATDAIRARFAILEKDREKSSEALKGMLGGIEQETPLGKIQSDYEQRLEIVRQFEQLHTDEVQRASEARMAVEQSYQDAKRNLMLTQSESLFGDLAGMAKSFAGEQSGIYRALFAVEKGFAIAQSAMAIQQSVAKAMAVGFPQNIPIIGQAVMQGAEIVSNIKSIAMPVGQAHDGIASVPREGTWVLDKNERVVKADDNKKLSRFLDNSEGSKPNINVNVTVSMDGNSNVESNSAYGKQIGQGLAAVVVSEVNKMTRPNGTLDRLYAKR
ncbi:phage tail tape measure protein [Psychrobacter sp. UBA6291]|uniref:phage tail tape measure protein n=1 Tax=Psychrobacter sp. UBA6291 TaxID=1947357 RepID=UPI00257D6F83|nr:phage tail tape measure protein [Psychrobacter sp. UBA6291]